MANGIQSTFAGNVTRDITLQHTQTGIAVANVDVAIAHRVKNGDRWEDGETTFIQCTVWRDLAEHAAASLTKGTAVIVTGTVYEETWEGKNGNAGVQKKCDVDELGISLRWGTAEYTKAGRGGGSPQPRKQVEDPWAPSAPDTEKAWNAAGSYSDETPF